MKLYSAWYCPFAQRAWMALLYKDIAFEYVEIDPYQKTEDWMRVSRGVGQVPVLDDKTSATETILIPDSMRILEYLEYEYADTAPLYPSNNQAIADEKYWIDFQGREIIPFIYRMLKAEVGSPELEVAKERLEQGLEILTAHMSDVGPYFSGETVSAGDMALSPFAQRIDILLPHYKKYALPKEGQIWKRYNQWWQAMQHFAPLKNITTDLPDYQQRLIEFYLPYSTGGGQQDVTQIK